MILKSIGEIDMNLEDNIVTITLSLTSDHLSLAIEALHRAKTLDQRRRDAISAIIHSFCGLESAVNFIGYEMFDNKDSQKYIEKDKRNLPLDRFIKSWNASLPFMDKLNYLFSIKKESIPAKLQNELRELNNLRNWLSHGFSYQNTLLIELDKTDKSKGTVIDSEYNIDWKKKFPNTKFKSLDNLDEVDAEKSLRIVLDMLQRLSVISEQPFNLITYFNKPKFHMIFKDTDINEILMIVPNIPTTDNN